jgi:hypothetical protein
MTVQDILYDVRALYDEYSEDGNILPSSEVQSIESNGLRFINMGLSEVYKHLEYYKTFDFTQNPTAEQLSARKWLAYTLPTDMAQIDQVVVDNEERTVLSGYRLEGYNTLYLPVTFIGDVRVIYKPKLVKLTAMTDELPNNNPIVDQFIAYYTAAKLGLSEDPNKVTFLEQKSNELKFEITKKQPSTIERITDVYFGGV